jgi:leucyl-tRNA synthetase
METREGPPARRHDPRGVEARWQARWAEEPARRVDPEQVSPEEKFYNLVEFPYPSAEGLHVGHAFTYAGVDVYGRYQRMRGRHVFQPMGFDSFGIHTENYALRVGEHPASLTAKTIRRYRGQLEALGAAWDWDRQVVTSDPAYYRWTQWVFLRLFKAGLAYRAEAPVVWCPSCATVLANEQLEGDVVQRCERCGTPVTERLMEQWFLRITAYADQLIDRLDGLDWPEWAKRAQREWIGRSRGVEIDFELVDRSGVLTVFTTRPDTLFGATFVAVGPSHPLARATGGGAFTGMYVRHPATGVALPVCVADYVVDAYGTGAIMGVPAHDERDFEFARRAGLAVVPVVVTDPAWPTPWTGEGVLADSGPFSGLRSDRAREAIVSWLIKEGTGRAAVRYRLRDWLISRQRYWGPPIPIVFCPACGTVPVPEEQLPVLLPDVKDFRPTGTGRSPLAAVEAFVATTCPSCGGPARRETDVSDTFLDSSWYFLRYPSSDVSDRPWGQDRTARMLPVDLYCGGQEHVRRHHLYARFVTAALHELGLVAFAEPFPKVRYHGLLILGGAKMSKSRGNVVPPDHYIARFGADNTRLGLLFSAPWEEGGDFDDRGMEGVSRFTARLWRLITAAHTPGLGDIDMRPVDRAVAAIGRDVERLKFNTAIASIMELTRWAAANKPQMDTDQWQRTARTIVLVVAPFAPHLAEELWSALDGTYSVHEQPWPGYDELALRVDVVTVAVQVDGRVRDRVEVPAGAPEEVVVAVALDRERVRRALDDNPPARVVYVQDRILNLVLS